MCFYKIEACDTTFSDSAILKNHIDSVHEKKKTYQCTTCDSIFDEAEETQTH